uniref:Peptidase S1 domain-containing protein n=1 Tax=Trichuris muris TaxID=70415 RepID=A0A5S6QI35_TRIMR
MMFLVVGLLFLLEGIPVATYECGRPVVKMRSRQMAERSFNRIVGGWEAAPHSFPWHVRVKTAKPGNRFMSCGGSLIQLKPGNSTDLVLTAAHCFVEYEQFAPASDISAVVGAHNFDNPNEPTRRIIPALQYVHPGFSARQKLNDIALIRLKQAVMHSDATIPVCLPKQNESLPFGKMCHVVGWGSISRNGISSTKLLQVDFEILDYDKCNRRNMNEDTVFCAGRLTGGRDTCQGDSGGSLVCEVNGKFVQFGIVSYGVGCGQANMPGIYTKVPFYVSWMKQKSESMGASSGSVNPAENLPSRQQSPTSGGRPTIASAGGSRAPFGSLSNGESKLPGGFMFSQRPLLSDNKMPTSFGNMATGEAGDQGGSQPSKPQRPTSADRPTIPSAGGFQSPFGSLSGIHSMFPGGSIFSHKPLLSDNQIPTSFGGMHSDIMDMMNQMGKRPGTGSSGSYTVTSYVNGMPSVQKYTF